MATVSPALVRPVMRMSGAPTITSSWMMLSFTPCASRPAFVMAVPPSTVPGYPLPKAMWQAAFSSNSVL